MISETLSSSIIAHMTSRRLLLLCCFLPGLLATTEWFGDLRAHLNPPNSPPFYDVTYDDTDCPMGLQSNAIPEFVYFGEMVGTKSVKEHSICLQLCLQNDRCKAVNFFEPLTKKENGFCELLSESQYDNPRLMRPFKKAIYYEKIRCRTEEDIHEYVTEADSDDSLSISTLPPQVDPKLTIISKKGSRVRAHKNNNTIPHHKSLPSSPTLVTVSNPSEVSASHTQLSTDPMPTGGGGDRSVQGRGREGKKKKKEEEVEEGSSTTAIPETAKKMDPMTLLKKLAAKVREFNLRFGGS